MRAAGPEALDLAIDDARVDLLDQFVVQAKALDRPWRHVLGHDVGLLDHLLDDLESLRRFQVQRYRLLVDVELVEVPRVVIGLAGAQPASGIAPPRVLDLDHLGAEPGQYLGRGCTRLELGEIDDLDALQKIEVLGHVAHAVSSVAYRGKCRTIACAFPRRAATPSRRPVIFDPGVPLKGVPYWRPTILSPGRMGADEFLVDVRTPARAFGQDEIAVFDDWWMGDDVVLPFHVVDVDLHDFEIRHHGAHMRAD